MALYHDQIDDFVKTVLDNYPHKRKWEDLSLEHQNHTFASQFFKNKKTPEMGGPSLKWHVQVRNTGTFQAAGLYHTDTTNVIDLAQVARTDWAFHTSNFIYDINEEAFQSDRETVVNYIYMREHSLYNDFFEGMEQELWTAPTSDTENPRHLNGIPFWVQKNASEGFNGGNPSGFSSGAGGISSTTYPAWSNYTFTYSSVDGDDFIPKVLRACAMTDFTPPHKYASIVQGAPDWSFYTTYRLLAQIQTLNESRNDNLGHDVGWSAGKAMLQSVPIQWVSALENSGAAYDSADPIYGINWKSLRYYFQKNNNMVRSKPIPVPGQSRVRMVTLDNWGNTMCTNRRLNFVGYAA